MTTTIGFVRPPGPMGDGIRYAGVLNFLQDHGFNVIDLPLTIDPVNERTSDIARAICSARPWQRGRGYARVVKEMEFNLLMLRNYRHAVKAGFDIAQRDDVHLLIAETHLAAVACQVAHRKRGLPYVYDMHGLAVDQMIGAKNTGYSIALAERWERLAVSDAEHVIAVTELMRQWVVDRYGYTEEMITVAPNGTGRPEKFAHFETPMRLVYGGVFAYWESVDTFLDLARLLPAEQFEFHLVGDGQLRDHLLNRINSEQLPVVYHGRKSRESTLDLFSRMQVGIAPSTNDMVRRTASPIKVLDYAACGLPIVTPDIGEWTDQLKRAGAAVVVPENSAEALAEGVRSLVDPLAWNAMSAAGRAMLEDGNTWEAALQPLDSLFRTLTSTPAAASARSPELVGEKASR